MTIGADGLGIAAYGTGAGLRILHCSDRDCASATRTTLAPRGTSPSLAIGADGLPIMSYYDSAAKDLEVAHCSNLACTAATTSTLDSAGDVGDHSAISAGSVPWVVYEDTTRGGLKLATCHNPVCNPVGRPPEQPPIDALALPNAAEPAIALAPDGALVVTYLDAANRDLFLARCAYRNGCATRALDSGGDVGSGSSVVIGEDGLPLITYRDDTHGAIKAAHCSDELCGAATTSMVGLNTDGFNGRTTVAIGHDGLGTVPWPDRVWHCTDSACALATTGGIPPVVGDPGNGHPWLAGSVSATIGVDGLPIFAWVASTDRRPGDPPTPGIVVSHCSSVFCTPYFRRR
jgi:hypothetical protein